MIVFNDTIIIEESVHQDWLEWLKAIYIPAMMDTGYFKSYQVLTVIDSPNEGVTYCVQYHAESMADFNKFYNQHFHKLKALHSQQFENQFVIFNTLMQTVD